MYGNFEVDGMFAVHVNGYHVTVKHKQSGQMLFERTFDDKGNMLPGWCDKAHEHIIQGIKALEFGVDKALKEQA